MMSQCLTLLIHVRPHAGVMANVFLISSAGASRDSLVTTACSHLHAQWIAATMAHALRMASVFAKMVGRAPSAVRSCHVLEVHTSAACMVHVLSMVLANASQATLVWIVQQDKPFALRLAQGMACVGWTRSASAIMAGVVSHVPSLCMLW